MKEDNKGSFTVEAALALPIFIISIVGFVFLFRVVLMQVQLQGALKEAGSELSTSAYLTTLLQEREDGESKSMEEVKTVGGKIATGVLVRKYFVKEKQYKNMLRGGISYASSSCLSEDDEISIIGEYIIQVPIPIIKLCRMPVMQRVQTRAYVGTNKLLTSKKGEGADTDEDCEYVYVTDTGVVYHKSLDCSSLKLSIAECMWNDLSDRRNVNGGRYKPCEKCCKKGSVMKSVYICADGDAYHMLLNCSGLKRTISRKKFNEVKDWLPVCSKCGR